MLPHTHLVKEHGLSDTRLIRSVSLDALAIALHNLPEELVMAVPAMTLRSRRFLLQAAVLSALAEPLDAELGLVAVAGKPSLNGHFIAFSAGTMIFVSIHELIPMAHWYRQPAGSSPE